MKYVLITGVSTGIGYDAAAELVARGYHVFGSVRKPADAQRVSEKLGKGFSPLIFDVTDVKAIARAVTQVEQTAGESGLTALINNAGVVTLGPLMHMSLEAFRAQMEVNVVGVLSVTQAFLPLLGAGKGAVHAPGRIINISSVSGRVVYPFMAAYAASKHALEAISDGFRRELMMYGIDVILIEPGTVRTPLMQKVGDQLSGYSDTDYSAYLESLDGAMAEREKTAIPVEKITELIRIALERERPKARYPIARKAFMGWVIPRLPDRLFDRLIARQLRLNK